MNNKLKHFYKIFVAGLAIPIYCVLGLIVAIVFGLSAFITALFQVYDIWEDTFLK